jgi:hypothetical protein
MTNENFLIDSISGGRFYADIVTKDGESYVYAPQEFVYKGLRQGDTQYFNQSFLNKEYLDKLKPIILTDEMLPDRLKNAGYEKPGLGVLIKREDFNNYSGDGGITYYNATGQFSGPVQGIGEKDGNLVYSVAGAEGSTYGAIGPDGVPYQTTVTITPPKKRGGVLGSIARSVTGAIASVPFLPDIVGIATGNPVLYGSLKAAQTAGSGGDLEDTIKSVVISGASMAAMQYALGPTDVTAGQPVGGTPGVSEVFPVDMSVGGTVTPLPPGSIGLPPVDLLGGTTFPSQGLSPPTGNELIQAPGALTPDVSLISPGAVFPGVGLINPTMPGIPSMGGGTGLTVGVPGGTVGAGGFTPEGAVPVLGDQGSFINDPNVLGRDVIQPGTESLSLRDAFDALRSANRVSGLLNSGGGQAVAGGVSDPGQMPAGSVDVSRLLSLLSGANVRTPNVYSLLG